MIHPVYKCKLCGATFKLLSHGTNGSVSNALDHHIKYNSVSMHNCDSDGRRAGIAELIGCVESDGGDPNA